METFVLPSSPIQQTHKQDWVFQNKIYHERYTRVDLFLHPKQQQYGALKQYVKKDMTEKDIEKRKRYIENEIRIHKRLDGVPRIVPLWFYYENEDEYGLMTKYMNRGTLGGLLYQYSHENCVLREVVYPMLITLTYLHSQGIIHRDLKPENIFIHHRSIYIGDFGYSYLLENEEEEATGLTGTLQYMAPEMLHSFLTKEPVKYRYEIDIWSLGIIIYELLFHRKPFGWSGYRNICRENPTNPTFIQNCLESPLEFPHYVSLDAQLFLSRCLEKNPKKRATVQELLVHPWIVNYLRKRSSLNGAQCPIESGLMGATATARENSQQKPQQAGIASCWTTLCSSC